MKQRFKPLLIMMLLLSFAFLQNMSFAASVLEMPADPKKATFTNVSGDVIFIVDQYLTTVVLQKDDGTKQVAILTSKDQIQWKILMEISDYDPGELKDFSLRAINGYLLINSKDGNVLLLSTDFETWQVIPLTTKLVDFVYSNENYYAIDDKGNIHQSTDLVTWNKLADLPSNQVVNLKALDLQMNGSTILVSHYQLKWGSDNYHRGLEVYDLKKKVWKETIGYPQTRGVLHDIVWTGTQFIISHTDLYLKQPTVTFYTSKDGITWAPLTNKGEALNQLKDSLAEDPGNMILYTNMQRMISVDVSKDVPVDVNLYLDGKLVDFEKQGAIFYNGRVLVPARELSVLLGGTVGWNAITRDVSLTFTDYIFKMTIKKEAAYINDQEIILDVPPMIFNGTTMVPVRFISDNLGLSTNWDGTRYSVYLVRP